MKYIDELFEKYEIRKNKKQKVKFIDWVKDICNDLDYECKVENNAGIRNIVIGNIENAKVVFTAHYDTCANMFLPNFCTPKNFLIYLIYQVGLMFVLMGVPLALASLFAYLIPDKAPLLFSLGFYVAMFVCIMIIVGPANKHTANDNTSGVATILTMLEKMPKDLKDKAAFVLFDLEELGLIGSGEFVSKHRKTMKNKLVINFDCVSDGDKMLFVLNKKTKNLISTFEKAYKDTDNVTKEVLYKGVFYPSDQVAFKLGVGVCSVNRMKFLNLEYIDKIHTNKDTVFKKENILYLVDGSIEFIKLYDK